MKYIVGKKGSEGVVLGPILKWDKQNNPEKEYIKDTISEVTKLESAISKVKSNTDSIMMQLDAKMSEILQAQMMILEDQGFINRIYYYIKEEHFSAPYACYFVGLEYEKRFEALEDEYLKSRATDIKDISNKIIQQLNGEAIRPQPKVPSIIVADEISPQDLSVMDKTKLLAIVTRYGSAICHTAIIANNYGIPYLYNVSYNESDLENDEFIIVDADNEVLVIDPDSDSKKQIQLKMNLQEYDVNTVNDSDLGNIKVTANIENINEIDLVKAKGAQGIGLVRTEFLYMNREMLPDEDEQFAIYKMLLEQMEDKEVIIRTLDVGGDKTVECIELPRETNPALGHRGIRICLEHTDIFRTQLRAIFRAAVFGNAKIMFPMISSLNEMELIKEQICIASLELKDRNIEHCIPRLGVMIETPSAAILSSELADIVDFFSIGSNDLIQYTYALDRNGNNLEPYYPSDFKAVEKLIQLTIENAHNKNKTVSLCGELGSNPLFIPKLVALGIDALSVSPYKINKVKELVSQSIQ